MKKIADSATAAPEIAAIRNQIGAPVRIAPAPKIGIANNVTVNNSVENIRSIIDQLKCFLNAGADLAGDGNGERQGADENDGVDGRFVTRMQTREPSAAADDPSRRPLAIANCR